MDSTLVYAFSVGMVATFNPCGFAMLPAYLSYFLGLESDDELDHRTATTVLRAVGVGAAMTAGFLVVFGVLGLVLDPVLSSINDKLPWVTMVLGLVLVVMGIRSLMGREIALRLPKVGRAPQSREMWSVFAFGISYALVSLSCTIALFIAAISTVIEQQNLLVGLAAFLAYGLGMGIVLMVLTMSIALARQGVLRRMRRILPHINRISGALLVLAGLYVVYYGWYELRVFSGETSGGGLAGWMFELNGRIASWIESVGAGRLGLLGGLVLAAVVFVALLDRARTDDH